MPYEMIEQRIRRDYEGEKPSEVLRGYILMGYGLLATSKAMRINHITCKKLADRFGLKFKPYKQLNRSCKHGPKRAIIGRMKWNGVILSYLVDRMKEAL